MILILEELFIPTIEYIIPVFFEHLKLFSWGKIKGIPRALTVLVSRHTSCKAEEVNLKTGFHRENLVFLSWPHHKNVSFWELRPIS